MRTASDLVVCGTPIHAAADDGRPLTYMVSDLHVPTHGGAVLQAFERLLVRVRTQARQTRLLVLGDLFSGIVNERQLAIDRWRDLVSVLRDTVAAGVTVTVLHGNRDFMLGPRFAAASGCRVVAGGLSLALDGQRVLVLHGDELCTNDEPYQRSKRWLRSWWVRRLCAMMPLPVAAAVGRRARATSGSTMARGDQRRFAPVVDAVAATFAAGFDVLVFGHVHTPGQGDVGAGRYFVLPAFDETGVFLLHRPGERLCFVPVDAAVAPPCYGALTFAPPLPAGGQPGSSAGSDRGPAS